MRPYVIALSLLLVLFGSIGTYLFQKFNALNEMDFSPEPVSVAVGITERGQWTRWLDGVGSIKAIRGIELMAETSGQITELHFESGQTVDQGQLLLVIDDAVEQATRDSNLAALELAQLLFDRDSQLIRQKSIPQTQYDRSRADLAKARADLAQTEARLADKRIRAPFAGTIGIRHVELGDYLSPGHRIASLQDTSALEIDFNLPAHNAPLLRVGLPIDIEVDAFPDQRFSAKLAATDSRVDAATRNLLVRARLDSGHPLIPGMFARLRVRLDDDLTVLTVPETAITYSLQGDVVWVIGAASGDAFDVSSKVVETGETRDGRTAILNGLELGDRVVTAGQHKLYRGARVIIDAETLLQAAQ